MTKFGVEYQNKTIRLFSFRELVAKSPLTTLQLN